MKAQAATYVEESISFEAQMCQVCGVLAWFTASLYFGVYWLTLVIGVTAVPATLACLVGEVRSRLGK